MFVSEAYNTFNSYSTTSATGDGYVVVKTGDTRLLYLLCVSNSAAAATGFIQVFDGYAQPSNGTVPLLSLPVKAVATIDIPSIEFKSRYSLNLKLGLTVALSSTQFTYTAKATEKPFLFVQYS
jgi:hypothetical protein